MKLYGYSALERDTADPSEITPFALGDVTLCASADQLRTMAKFFEHCASEMERMGSRFDHIHLSDEHKEFSLSPQFVVAAAIRV
jgi:hypothetical protein